jgi:hypothetical protein
MGRLIRLVFLTAVGVGLIGLLVWWIPTELLTQDTAPKPCQASSARTVKPQTTEHPPKSPENPADGRFGAAIICLLCVGLGRLLSHLSAVSWLFGLVVGGNEGRRSGLMAVQLGLSLLLLFGSAALGYETLAVAKDWWPVTDYVRCANDVGSGWTLVVAAAVCVLLGNWLWHAAPPPPGTRPA